MAVGRAGNCMREANPPPEEPKRMIRFAPTEDEIFSIRALVTACKSGWKTLPACQPRASSGDKYKEGSVNESRATFSPEATLLPEKIGRAVFSSKAPWKTTRRMSARFLESSKSIGSPPYQTECTPFLIAFADRNSSGLDQADWIFGKNPTDRSLASCESSGSLNKLGVW